MQGLKDFLSRLQASTVFSIASIVLFVAYLFIKPPLMGPDEINHFIRAYQVSEGGFVAEVYQQRLGGSLPICVKEVEALYRPYSFLNDYKFTTNPLPNLFTIPAGTEQRVFIDFPNTANYAAINYLPYAIPIYIARKLQLSMAWAYYGGKVLVFLLFFFGMRYCIKGLPFLNWSIAFLLLLPMNQYLLASVSGDPMTTLLVLLSFTLLVRSIYEDKSVSTGKLLLFLVLAIALALGKVVYCVVFLALLLIPRANFGSAKRKWSYLLLFSLLVGAVAMLWAQQVEKQFISYDNYNPNYHVSVAIHPDVDFSKQKDYIKQHPSILPTLLAKTLQANSEFYLRSFVSGLGAYIEVLPDTKECLIILLLLVLLSINGSSITLPVSHRLFFIGLAALLFVGTLLSQYLIWTPVAAPVVEGVQGRYFYPLMPFLLLGFCFRTKVEWPLKAVLVILVCIYTNYKGLNGLYKRYYVDSSMYYFMYTNNFEKTSSPATIENAVPLSALFNIDAGGGTKSLVIPPGQSCTLIPSIFQVKYDDVITVTAWVKGTGAQLSFAGEGTNGSAVQINHTELNFTNEKGWSRLLMHFGMFYNIKNDRVSFFIENKGSQSLNVDDITVTCKRKH